MNRDFNKPEPYCLKTWRQFSTKEKFTGICVGVILILITCLESLYDIIFGL